MSNSLSLSVQNKKSLAENEEKNYMTTKQIAEQLHTSPKVVLANAKKCLPNKIFENGKTTYFSKEEVTVIIEQMKTSNPNQSTFTGAVKAVSTDLTPALKIRNAMLMMQEAYEEELKNINAKYLAEKAERNQLQTKNNLLMHIAKTYTASEIAKELGLTSAQKLNQVLKEKEIQYYRNGTWLPTSKYSDKEYYEIKQDVLDNGIVIYNSRFTQKGRDFILSLREKGEI